MPFDALLAWTAAGLATPEPPGSADSESLAGPRAARAGLRAALAKLVMQPEFTAALAVASPALLDSRAVWLERPDTERGQRVERALVRYLLRACARATPFGLFAATSTGALGPRTDLRLAPRHAYARHTRLDLGYLTELVAHVSREHARAERLPLFPNPSAYRLAGRWRYVEVAHVAGARQHRLVAVDEDAALRCALTAAASGACPPDLATHLARTLDVPIPDARAYIDSLAEAQVLTTDLAPPLTGLNPEAACLARLSAEPATADVGAHLLRARAALDALDAAGVGAPLSLFDALHEALRPLPVQPEPGCCVHVELVKPLLAGHLGPEVVAEARRAVELLSRLRGRPLDRPLQEFTERFLERYPEGEAPLVEVLDEEHGLGFEHSAAEPSVLLEGLEFHGTAPAGRLPPGHDVLVELLTEALASRRSQVVLDEASLARLCTREPARLPDAFALTFELAAASPEALAAGAFELCVGSLVGPSGARLLGRFCHADPELQAAVRAHLRAEEALQPEALFAELVHLPEGRTGNVLARPVLRAYEIPYLGRSGAAPEQLLTVDDLFVSLGPDGLRLRSRRLGREVVPRLSSAHNYGLHGLGLYRFLAALQDQHCAFAPAFSWGALEAAVFLPRVTHGRLVLARARWRLTAPRLARLREQPSEARAATLREWRDAFGWPRFVELTEGDHVLVFDLDNALALDVLAELLRGRQEAFLFEMLPGPESLAVHGPEGRYVAEFVLPFERAVPVAASVSTPERAPITSRRFLPGDEWLEARIFAGPATLDGLIAAWLLPLIRAWRAQGLIERFFFARFGAPAWHLRARFRGQPGRLHAELQPLLVQALRPHVESGRVRRLAFETYEREVLRYGGPEALEACEAWFAADSEAVGELVSATPGAAAHDLRPRLLLAGIDALLDDFGRTLSERAALARRMAALWRDELRASDQKLRLDELYRRERARLVQVVGHGSPGVAGLGLSAPTPTDAHTVQLLAHVAAALSARTRHAREAVGDLRARADAGQLTARLPELLGDLAHMHANRLLRGAAREHEYVAWDFLARLYESAEARGRGRGQRPGKERA
jgi:thiopeptide-type bacteriocin biosynthesis protein